MVMAYAITRPGLTLTNSSILVSMGETCISNCPAQVPTQPESALLPLVRVKIELGSWAAT